MCVRCCKLDGPDHTILVKGKPVRFSFSRRFGPLVLDKDGDPVARQPISERNPFWTPFERWLVEYDLANPYSTLERTR